MNLDYSTLAPTEANPRDPILKKSESSIVHLFDFIQKNSVKAGFALDIIMSAIPRLAARVRQASYAASGSSSRISTPAAVLRCAPVLSSSVFATRQTARSLVISPRAGMLNSSRRWASTANATKEEEEEEEEEEKWPVRILPELTQQDLSRLKRQRNVGM